MQIAMWTVLALTLGLAGFISRQKRQNFSVILGNPTPVGDLTIRLPVGWHFLESRSEDGLAIRGREPVTGDQRSLRAIDVTQERQSDPLVDAQSYLSNNVLDAGALTLPIRFTGLKSDGVLAEIEKPPEADAAGNTAPPGFYACAVVPLPGETKLAVVVSVEDIPPLTPADREMLRQIVETITLAPRLIPPASGG